MPFSETFDGQTFFDPEAERKAREKEICICAAVVTTEAEVYPCHRHADGIIAIKNDGKEVCSDQKAQGFLTSKNRFISREEAYKLQIEAGIKSASPDGYYPPELFSEDLY
jgi:hypothetical protein